MKPWIAVGTEALVFAGLLFGCAGTVRWPEAWVFLVVFFGWAAVVIRMLARHDPALLGERMKFTVQKEQPIWDRILITTITVLFVLWLAVIGLDVRLGRPHLPPWMEALGGLGLFAGWWISYLAFRENTFLAPVVKIQRDRGHSVVTTGPYAVVRHPLYAGGLLLLPSSALLLGSPDGLWGALVLDAGIVLRTALEDRKLHRELEGYREYAARVRYRLVPLLW